jgi:hypothetical protein
MWTYVQATGELVDSGGRTIGVGYSGAGEHKNRPESQFIRDKGPVPCGIYYMQPPRDTVTHGPYFIPLMSGLGNEMRGRDGFAIHGDSKAKPGTASQGCIIQSRATRETAWGSGDHVVHVIARELDGADEETDTVVGRAGGSMRTT